MCALTLASSRQLGLTLIMEPPGNLLGSLLWCLQHAVADPASPFLLHSNFSPNIQNLGLYLGQK